MKYSVFFLFVLILSIAKAQPGGSLNALDFDGVSDYVNINHNAALNPGTAFTVEAWINAESWATNSWQNTIVSKDMWSSISEGWVIRCGNGGRLSFNLALNNNGSWYEVLSGSVMSLNKWYHVAGTYDGSVLRMYLNGKEIGTLSQSGSITATTAPVKIGNIAMTGQSRFFDGKIDEVRIWNATLSEAILRQYMCRKIDLNHPNINKLIAHYTINNGSGSVVSDSGPNGFHGTNSGAAWLVSGAPIGDASGYSYPTSWTGKNFKYGHSAGDTLEVSSVTGSPQGIHIYYINAAPNFTTTPPGVASFYTTRYYGVYVTSGSNVTFKNTYHYNGFPSITNQGKLNYSYRLNHADTSWAGLVTSLDSIQKTIIKTSASAGEYILGKNDELSNFLLHTPVTSSNITIQGGAGQTIPFDWFSSHLTTGGDADYEWLMDYDTADFSTPLGTKISSSAGSDTSVSVTYIDLANIMATAGYYYGQTFNAAWSVRATAGPVEKLALLPFNISITRDILSSDLMYNFNLDQPDEDTLLVLDGSSLKEIFNWKRARSTAGSDISYTVEFAGHTGTFSSPVGTFTADNAGKDTVAGISQTDLAVMLQNAGIPQLNIYKFKWRVKAEIGSLFKYSNDSNYVYISWDKDITGLTEYLSKTHQFRVYPIPVKDVLFIESPSDSKGDLKLELLNCAGEIVQTADVLSGKKVGVELPADLPGGMYLLKINHAGGLETHKILLD